MARKPQLPASLQAEINAVLGRAGIEYRAGELLRSLEIAEEAWDMIPSPPYDWDYYAQSLSVNFVKHYAELGDIAQVDRWTPRMYAAYDDPEKRDHLTLMTEGEARLKIGQREQATELFTRIFNIYGPEGFKGEQRRHLEMIGK